MARVIAIINQKGGVGKTTTTIQLGALLKALGKRVLLIDMDPQCNLSFASRGNLESYSILDSLLSNAYAKDIIQKQKYYDLIVSNGNLASYAQRLKGEKVEFKLKEVIEPLRKMYDFILIDSPPTLGEISVGILTAADSMIIPVNADIFSLEGLKQIYLTYSAVNKYTNNSLRIDGVLLTRVDESTDPIIYSAFERITKSLKIHGFRTVIHESSIVKKSNLARKPIWADKEMNDIVLKDYYRLSKELNEIWGGALDEQQW